MHRVHRGRAGGGWGEGRGTREGRGIRGLCVHIAWGHGGGGRVRWEWKHDGWVRDRNKGRGGGGSHAIAEGAAAAARNARCVVAAAAAAGAAATWLRRLGSPRHNNTAAWLQSLSRRSLGSKPCSSVVLAGSGCPCPCRRQGLVEGGGGGGKRARRGVGALPQPPPVRLAGRQAGGQEREDGTCTCSTHLCDRPAGPWRAGRRGACPARQELLLYSSRARRG